MSDRVTARDIENQEFRRKFRGYDPEDVHLVLKAAAENIERLTYENSGLREELGRIKAEVETIRERETALQDTLVSAQRMAGEFRQRSQSEAELLIKEARHKAERTLNQARDQVDKIHDEQLQARLDRDAFERSLRGLIEQHSRLLDLRIEGRTEVAADNIRVFRTAQGTDAG